MKIQRNCSNEILGYFDRILCPMVRSLQITDSSLQ